jgi:general secretion pathway protein K
MKLLFRSARQGAMIIVLVISIGTSGLLIANNFAKEKLMEYKVAEAQAKGFKAFLLARAGLQGAIGALKKIPEEILYQSGIAFNPPPVPLAGGTIFYKMYAEDGKININNLVKTYDQSPNLRIQEMMYRLYEQMGIKRENISYLIDWIDDNNEGNAEVNYYSGLKPPRKIKNGPLYTLSELTSVRGYDTKIVYGSLKPADLDKNTSKDFLSEEEKLLVTDNDYVLSNNITAFIPYKDTGDDRININSAPYHVLMSLSDFMTRSAAMRILKYKIEKGGYIKELKDLEKFAEFQAKTGDGYTLFNELVGESSSSPQQNPTSKNTSANPNDQQLSIYGGRIKTKGEIYKITGVGMYKNSSRRVTCLYDLPNDKILFYSED